MPDCSAMWIKIGGVLKEEHVEEFAELISELGLEYDDVLGEDAEQHIREDHEAGKPLCLYDNERPWGSHDHLEGFCQTVGLSYARGDDGHYSYAASCVLWTPEIAKEREWTSATDSGEPFLSVTDIDQLVAKGELEAELALMRQVRDFAVPFSAPGWPEDAEDADAAA
ncbi:MAG: hypothetical protein RJA36_1409 [Pseudomonadota bacterium]|jgi:hypothetical protein